MGTTMLFAHITFAILGLVVTGFTWLSPSRHKLNFSYFLIAMTVATGSYLVIMKPAHLVSACFSGLIYLSITLSGILAAKGRLSKVEGY